MTPAEQAKLASIIVELSQMIGPTQGPTPPVITPPVVAPPSVPVSGRVIDVSVPMDGTRVTTSGFGEGVTVIAMLVVPEWPVNNTNTISVFEYGAPPTTRMAWMSKTRGDMSATSAPFYFCNDGPVFSFCIRGNDPNAVQMQPGEVWYLMVKNERPFGMGSSCTSGSCDIGIKWYPPN